MNQKKTNLLLAVILSFCMVLIFPGGDFNVKAAAVKTKKISGITYKVNNSKKTVTILKSSKSIKTVKIAGNVRIQDITYKVTTVSSNAFKNCTKLKKATIGKNIKTISSNAFLGDKKLGSVTINTNSLVQIGDNAFKGIRSNAIFYVPKAKYNKYQKLIKRKKTGWKNTMKIVVKGDSTKDSTDSADKSNETIDVSKYNYTVTPLTDNICHYFYVKTDNPDPESFDFIDENTTLSDSKKCFVSRCSTEFADVEYTDKKTLRVQDGYIFYSAQTDGGKLTLESIKNGKHEVTKQSVTIPGLKSSEEYLIDNYTTESMSFFEKMDAVQKGLNGICLYSGVYVLGKLNKSTTTPYYGLSTSPHVDQTFYIQDPYYRSDSKTMLVSSLYPFRLDSIGFPSEMSAVAKMLDSSVSCKWNSSYHWLIDVTYAGETKSYGGQGNGGGQGITSDLIKYKYLFNGSAGDAFTKSSWSDIRSMIEEYGNMTVQEEEKDLPELTWQDVCDTVGTDGSYVKLVLIHSIFGGEGVGYTFLYKNGSSSYPGYFSNAWYDGRYFNSYEFFEKGTTFDDQNASTADIIVKNARIPFPNAPEGKEYLYDYSTIDKVSEYDASTGVWSGFMKYSYDGNSKTWIASVYNRSTCYDKDTYKYSSIDDKDFKDACTLTLDEVKAMSVDGNANTDPKSYYNYDMTVSPGTEVK